MIIYKYMLEFVPFQYIQMPLGAELLDIQLQHGTPCLWAKVLSDMREATRRIVMVGTGWEEVNHTGAYIATVQLNNGLVFHFFDEGWV